jgi:hypothetical protein
VHDSPEPEVDAKYEQDNKSWQTKESDLNDNDISDTNSIPSSIDAEIDQDDHMFEHDVKLVPNQTKIDEHANIEQIKDSSSDKFEDALPKGNIILNTDDDQDSSVVQNICHKEDTCRVFLYYEYFLHVFVDWMKY